MLLRSKEMFWAGLIKPVRAKCLQGWKRSRCWTPKAGSQIRELSVPNCPSVANVIFGQLRYYQRCFPSAFICAPAMVKCETWRKSSVD